MDSTSDTYVKGEKVGVLEVLVPSVHIEIEVLRDGDVITIGGAMLVFKLVEG